MPVQEVTKYAVYESPAPIYSPWANDPNFERFRQLTAGSLVTPDRLWILYLAARQALHLPGDWYECGVYRGGTAQMLAAIRAERAAPPTLRLFDTFEGMPAVDHRFDLHGQGDFSDTSLAAVKQRLAAYTGIKFHKGLIPDTFRGRKSDRIALAHVDVDIHSSVLACCEFIYPRLVPGGLMVFDDYGFESCPGARMAVDEYFADKPEPVFALFNGHAIVTKLKGSPRP